MTQPSQNAATKRYPLIQDAFNPLAPSVADCKRTFCMFWKEADADTGSCALEGTNTTELTTALDTLRTALITNANTNAADLEAAITALQTSLETLLGDALTAKITAAIDASTVAKEPVVTPTE